jgi:ABC-type phosphate/phosphonate transport system permease subunit
LSEAGVTVAAPSAITRAWRRAVDTFNTIVSGTVVALGVVIPLALLAAIVLLLARVLRSRFASWWPHDA